MTKRIFTIPNCVTMFRVFGTIGLVFTEIFSVEFYVIYTLCGLSDVVDGWIARTKNLTSELGAKLDSIADLLYYAMMGIMIFPVLWERLPGEIWYVVAFVLAIRVVTYIMVAVKHKCFSSMHTYGNKLTGIGVFGIPYFLSLECGVVYCIVACTISVLATMEEFLMHVFSKKYNPQIKTIFQMER